MGRWGRETLEEAHLGGQGDAATSQGMRQPPEAGRGEGEFCPGDSGGSMSVLTPLFCSGAIDF